MASASQQAIQLMADEIVQAIKTLTDTNNKSYVDNQLANFKLTSANLSSNFKIGTENLSSDFIIGKTNISTELYAAFAEIAALEAKSIKVDVAQIENLTATIASIVTAQIGTASIGYAQIKDLDVGTALIRKGVSGKFYIDDLSVTDANIVSLSAGELMLRNSSGKMVKLVVDSQGTISTQEVTYDGDDIVNSNSLNATRIVESSITARELNVSSIFADSALIGAISATNIDVGTLFAAKTFLGNLYTSMIQNPTVIIGDTGVHNVGLATWSNVAPSSPEDGDGWVDTSVSPNVYKEYDEDTASWITVGALSSLKSAINLEEQKISLVVDGSSTSSSLVLTNEMLTATAENIDLSANHTMTFSATQLAAIAEDIDLSANHTMTFSATQLAAIAEDIDLSANHTMTFSATQLAAIAEDIDLSANDTITVSAAKVEAVIDQVDISSAKGYSDVVENLQDLEDAYADNKTATDAQIASNTASIQEFNGHIRIDATNGTISIIPEDTGDYSTQVRSNGFFIIQDGTDIAAMRQHTVIATTFRAAEPEDMEETRIHMQIAPDGGIAFVPSVLKDE